MSVAHTSAIRSRSHPGSAGLSLKPYPGSDGHTTWNASAASAPWAAGSASGPMTSRNSTTEPGQPWVVTDVETERGHRVRHGRTLGTRRPRPLRQHAPPGGDVEEPLDVATDDLGAGRRVVHALVHVLERSEAELGDPVDIRRRRRDLF